ncbi:transcription factor bHLH80-like [Salvia divinorum]|uniref:Transcription factor bHLH80-like n=1 Tax=Salvia divinorum TaxID=28513 RepID=A0ABD1FT18_SALDI
MQPSRGSGSAELNRSDGGGLARYRSAPATWLDALLESDEEQVLPDVVLDIPRPHPPPNASDVDLQLLDSAGGGGFSNFLRMNSSPAEFLSLLNSSEGLLSNLGIPADYELVPEIQAERAREAEDLDRISPKKSPSSSSSSTRLKREKPRQLQGSGGSLDLEMENLLEDSVMCRARAKRGCATHPRSIAERERRTRISDRIRKLQELVPNMDKQTNTADMLEEAVAYVKHLQKEIQDLTEHQKKCRCSTND